MLFYEYNCRNCGAKDPEFSDTAEMESGKTGGKGRSSSKLYRPDRTRRIERNRWKHGENLDCIGNSHGKAVSKSGRESVGLYWLSLFVQWTDRVPSQGRTEIALWNPVSNWTVQAKLIPGLNRIKPGCKPFPGLSRMKSERKHHRSPQPL